MLFDRKQKIINMSWKQVYKYIFFNFRNLLEFQVKTTCWFRLVLRRYLDVLNGYEL